MEIESISFRRPNNVRNSGIQNRKRRIQSPFSPESATKLPDISIPQNSFYMRESTELFVKNPPNLREVLKMKDLEESDYDSVRPTLITLTAKQLKSFMDRNPQMERIADGLFRRHCQIDCPEIVPKKIKMETWRTMHDVFMNWKMYEEAKKLEKGFNKRTQNMSKIDYK